MIREFLTKLYRLPSVVQDLQRVHGTTWTKLTRIADQLDFVQSEVLSLSNEMNAIKRSTLPTSGVLDAMSARIDSLEMHGISRAKVRASVKDIVRELHAPGDASSIEDAVAASYAAAHCGET